MSQAPLSLEEFRDLVESHGVDFARWPVGTLAAAGALILKDPKAADLFLKACRRFDRARAHGAQEKLRAPAGLANRIVAAAMAADPPARKTKPKTKSR